MKLGKWLKELPLRSWIVLAWLLIGCAFTSWWLFFLLFPVYWQVWIKQDVALIK